jgi:hypothetical protein
MARRRRALARCVDPGLCEEGRLRHRCGYCRTVERKRRNDAVREPKRKEREMLQKMTSEERTSYRNAQKLALRARQYANDSTMIRGQSTRTTLLTLPLEIRQQIYKILYQCRNWIYIERTTPPPMDGKSKLHHVCRLLRLELDTYFYERNYFVFRTLSAIESWRHRHTPKLSSMFFIELRAPSPLPIRDLAEQGLFQRLKTLVLQRPKLHNRENEEDVLQSYRHLEEGPSPWEDGLLLVWRQPELIVNCLEQFRHGIVEWIQVYGAGYYRASKYVISFCTEREEDEPEWSDRSWTPINVAVSQPCS